MEVAGAGGPQVFSVRQRGRGSEQRGFVELVLTDTAITTADGTLLTRVTSVAVTCPLASRMKVKLNS